MKTDLLSMVENGGCSAKLSASQLDEVLKILPLPVDSNILVDIDTHDDAGVYRVNDDLALVLTTDFFPPVCSDPYEFGQIAAANSISDVYAMGGMPVVALNIMMFPSSMLPMEAYSDIIRGGYDKAAEAGLRIIGGHTIDDSTPKYGLAVVGYVHPDKVITNAGCKPGDALILTKPLGTGVILAGHRLRLTTDSNLYEALNLMKILNKNGAEVMKQYGIRGATDVTGFGLAGHAMKMAKASKVTISLKMSNVPLINGVYELIDQGCIPGATFRNLDYAGGNTEFVPGMDYNLKMAAFDAQTSGGLLMSVSKDIAEDVISVLHSEGLLSPSIIGSVEQFSGSYLKIGD